LEDCSDLSGYLWRSFSPDLPEGCTQ
jgi:hypothetical protein